MRVLRHVQRSGESGSPGAVGSTNASRSLQQGRVEGGRPFAAPARATRPLRRQRRVRIGFELAKPAANRGGRDARGPRHLSDAAVTQGPRLGGGPEATRPLRKHGEQRRMLGPKRRQRHGLTVPCRRGKYKSL